MKYQPIPVNDLLKFFHILNDLKAGSRRRNPDALLQELLTILETNIKGIRFISKQQRTCINLYLRPLAFQKSARIVIKIVEQEQYKDLMSNEQYKFLEDVLISKTIDAKRRKFLKNIKAKIKKETLKSKRPLYTYTVLLQEFLFYFLSARPFIKDINTYL